jgi:diguanylate cyclase (GGDEF)-like protein
MVRDYVAPQRIFQFLKTGTNDNTGFIELMDAITAGIALIVTQLCLSLVMTGLYFAEPREKCTRYWAIASIMIAAGAILVVLNAGLPRFIILILGTSSLIWGTIVQYWGVQAFYKQAENKTGWVIGSAFSLLLILILLLQLPASVRMLLLSSTLLIVLILNFRVLWNGAENGRTFGNLLTLGTTCMLIVNNVVRISESLAQNPDFLSNTRAPLGIVALYLIPLGGSLMYASGLLLLYFERVIEEKHHLATHDELTGMLNRRAIVTAGEREVAIALRNHQPLTIALLDIDFFKRVNDTLGHSTGDLLLIEIGRLLKNTCRTIDLVGRYGGEEFCIIFPGVGVENAATVGERLLNAVRQYRFNSEYQMTISVGLASLPEDAQNRSWMNIINQADKALYQAKEAGRDQYRIAEQYAESEQERSIQEQ